MNEELTLPRAIKRIAWGYILIHNAINLGKIDVLPDWLGYYFMLIAIRRIREEEESIGLLEPLVKILIGWNALVWGSKFIGWNLSSFPLVILISVIVIYFNFQLLTNLANVAERHGSEKKKNILTVRTIETLMNTILICMSYLEISQGWMISVMIIGLLSVIWICIVLFNLAAELEKEVAA